MKKYFLSLLLLLGVAIPAFAQKGNIVWSGGDDHNNPPTSRSLTANDLPAQHREPVSTAMDANGHMLYVDFSERDLMTPEPQHISITKAVVFDFQCVPSQPNPPAGNARFYCDSGTNQMVCKLSTGASCLGGGGGAGSVTSVGLGTPTGFGVSGSPVTSTGTLQWSMPSGWVLGDLLVGNGPNSVARLAAPTTPDGVTEMLVNQPSGGATQSFWSVAGLPGRVVSGTTDTIVATDRTPQTIEYQSNSPTAITVPDPASAGFNGNPAFITIAEGLGPYTFTPQTSAVITWCDGSNCFAGQPNIVLQKGESAKWSSPTTSNWLVRKESTQPIANPPVVNGLISGGGVTWTGLLTFTCSAAQYAIGGTVYNSPQTNITLSAADPSNPRIDVIAVNSSGACVNITGTPAGSPAAPSVDPTTQLSLTFVTIAANATTPTLNSILVYDENSTPPTEYTCTPTANFNCNSTNNPFHLTHDIEATTAVATNSVTLVNSGTVNFSTYSTLSFNIRNKANWPSAKSLQICFLNSTTVVGNCVAFKNGVFGFNQTNITSYQQIVIPLSVFALGSTVADRVRFQVIGGGGSIGFYLDWIQIQSTLSGSGGSSFQLQVNGQNTQQTANLVNSGTVTFSHVPGLNGVDAITATASGSGLSGMTAGQVPIAATATTVTSSKAIQGTDSSLLSSGTVSGTGASLCTDANGGATTSGCTGGGVTSVAMTVPTAEFSVSGSPITTSGTLAVTKLTQNPNLVWAGPTSSASSNLVQSAQTTNNSTTPITLAYPSNVTAADLIIVVTASYNGTPTSLTTNQGDTFQHPINFTTHGTNYDVYYECSAVGGATTVSAARAGNSQFIMHIYEFSGNAAASCLDASFLTYGSNTVPALPSMTTTGSVSQSTELVFASLEINSIAGPSLTAGSGYSALQGTFDTGNVQQYMLEEIKNTTTGLSGAQTATFVPSVNGSGNYQGVLLTFKLNTSGASQPTFRALVPGDIPSGAQATGVVATGTQTISGCSLSSPLGGSFAGSFVSGTTGTCTVTITPGIQASHGYACTASDLTTVADVVKQTAYTSTTATMSGTTVSSDLITWNCAAF